MSENTKLCSVPGCCGRHIAKGYCRKHYGRQWNNGTLDLQNKPEPFENRYLIDAMTGCWIWQRGKDKDGYGKMKVAGRDVRAHRHAWEQANGAIPFGALLCHRCDTPSCVNPDHIFLGSHGDNHADRNSKGRTASGERHGASKLTADDVDRIRAERPGYLAAREQYGIGKTHYHRIIRGEGWRS